MNFLSRDFPVVQLLVSIVKITGKLKIVVFMRCYCVFREFIDFCQEQRCLSVDNAQTNDQSSKTWNRY